MIVPLVWIGVFALTVFNGYLAYEFGPLMWIWAFASGWCYGHFVLSTVF